MLWPKLSGWVSLLPIYYTNADPPWIQICGGAKCYCTRNSDSWPLVFLKRPSKVVLAMAAVPNCSLCKNPVQQFHYRVILWYHSLMDCHFGMTYGTYDETKFQGLQQSETSAKWPTFAKICRQTASISGTKSQHLKVYCIVLQLSAPKPLKPDVKSIMKVLLEQRRRVMLQLHLSE